MIALDTNVLVCARRAELPRHARARRLLKQLAKGDEPWALPWPCLYEYVRVVTHRGFFGNPSPLEVVLADLETLLASPSLTLLAEGPAHAAHMSRMLRSGDARGNMVFDARIAAIAVEHGVRELWTADRDFARFPGLTVRNPFD